MLTPKQPVINAVLITLITQLRKITGWLKKNACFSNNCNSIFNIKKLC